MRRVGPCFLLTLAGLLVGCGNGDPKDDGDPKEVKDGDKDSRLTRFSFRDEAEANTKVEEKMAEAKAKLIDPTGKEVDIASYEGQPLVVVFMRGFNGKRICPYCTTYTAQIAVRYPEIKKAGAEVLLVYPTREEDQDQVAKFQEIVNDILKEDGKEALPFPVFLDPGTKVVKEYNIEGDITKPSTFVLDKSGVTQYAYVGSNTTDRPSVDRILQEVEALSK